MTESNSCEKVSNSNTSSQKEILKATSIVGGAQIIQIIIRIIRTKIIAVLLGPLGIGIMGLYFSTTELAKKATGLGLEFSAVREVAEAVGANDETKIGRKILILRRWVWFTGSLGFVFVFFFSNQLSEFAFKNPDHSFEIKILSVVPVLAALTGGQMAILRGTRRITEMAKAEVLGAIIGFCLTMPLFWIIGIKGIVIALVITAILQYLFSYYYANKIKIKTHINVSFKETVVSGAGMIKLGIFTVVAGIITTGTIYLVQVFLSNKIGVDGVGQFQAALSISTMYVGLILNAMGTDYFPRLSSVNQNNKQIQIVSNQQIEVSLLLAAPLIIILICFMDIAIELLYSNKFHQSQTILLWQMLGNLIKVISWPLGFIILAKGKGLIFVLTEAVWNLIFLGTIILFWEKVGFEIIGISFLFAYLVQATMVVLICRRLSKFSWEDKNIKLIVFCVFLSVLSFCNTLFKIQMFWRLVSVLLVITSCVYSYYGLSKIVDVKLFFKKIKNRFK